MATYIYETVPRQQSESPRRFEIVQSMKDAPLTNHPETGEPVRRVISGGYGIMSKPQASNSAAGRPSSAACSPGCACHSGPRLPTP